MSDDDSESSINLKEGILQRIYDYTFGGIFSIISSLTLNGLFAGLPTVFSAIVWVLKIIFMALYYILFKIVPFLIQYVGIPMFILGAILGIMFLGGHMLFVVLFIVGMYFYIRGLFNVKLVSKAPKVNSNSNTSAAPPKENNNEFKVK